MQPALTCPEWSCWLSVTCAAAGEETPRDPSFCRAHEQNDKRFGFLWRFSVGSHASWHSHILMAAIWKSCGLDRNVNKSCQWFQELRRKVFLQSPQHVNKKIFRWSTAPLPTDTLIMWSSLHTVKTGATHLIWSVERTLGDFLQHELEFHETLKNKQKGKRCCCCCCFKYWNPPWDSLISYRTFTVLICLYKPE